MGHDVDIPQACGWGSFLNLHTAADCTEHEPEGAVAARAGVSTQNGSTSASSQEGHLQSQSSEAPDPLCSTFPVCVSAVPSTPVCIAGSKESASGGLVQRPTRAIPTRGSSSVTAASTEAAVSSLMGKPKATVKTSLDPGFV